jgi:hypothetical protein
MSVFRSFKSNNQLLSEIFVMHKSNQFSQLFRSRINAHTVHLSIDLGKKDVYTFLGEDWTKEDLEVGGWEPIEQSTFLGIPELSTLGKEYFDFYIKGQGHGNTAKEFLQDFIANEDPINDAVYAIVDDILRKRSNTPWSFTKAIRAYCESELKSS